MGLSPRLGFVCAGVVPGTLLIITDYMSMNDYMTFRDFFVIQFIEVVAVLVGIYFILIYELKKRK